ncbi:MAG: hypothetical protein AAFN78_21015 [Pseudomonadota bacterium]
MKRNLIFTAVCLSFACAGSLNAQTPNADFVKKQSPAQAELHDLQLVAKAKGWTVEQARADREAAEAVGAVAVKLAQQRPDLFVGSELAVEPGGTPRLYVKGKADRSVFDIVAESRANVEIVDNQPYSYDELEKRKLEVHTAIASMGYEDLMTAFDFREGGKINVEVTRRAGLPEASRQVRDALPEALRADVEISMLDAPVGEDFAVRGGMAVYDDGVRECTSGWSVRTFWGTTGMTTAGHCTGINEIGSPGGTSMSHQAEHRGSWGDIEWKTTPTSEVAEFYATSSSIRDTKSVESWAALSVGESICFYGRSSNSRDCSFDVDALSVSCTVSGVFNDRLVRMDGNSAIGGDSGGGWSWGTRAYGSVKGICGGRAVFSFADYYDEALGVFVLIK